MIETALRLKVHLPEEGFVGSGILESASTELEVMLKAGSDPWGSREIVMKTYILFPSEEAEPDSSQFLWPFF